MKTDMNPNAKLSFVERFGYGVGDYAGNLVYSAISAFLLVYYTNVVGANAAAAASIIAISKIFDGISDLVMGYIIDHTHTANGARPAPGSQDSVFPWRSARSSCSVCLPPLWEKHSLPICF